MPHDGTAPTIAIVAAGAMGAAVGKRLSEHGAKVMTVLEGRSARTAERAREAGMVAVAPQELAAVELILSIAPPSEALGLANSLASILGAAPRKPVFIDCNAVNPETMRDIAAALAATGCDVLDCAIIGPPPSVAQNPCFYVSGDPKGLSLPLADLGLRLRRVDGPVGAAKTLKMVYAGINKGLVGLGAAMLLAASNAGCAESLREEMGESLPAILARLTKGAPDMYPKAYRWVGEMHEIAAFLERGDPARGFFEAAAGIFARFAADHDGPGDLEAKLNAALGLGTHRLSANSI
ncbi:MAG: DUF1932 domain-containing protein [Verrucomicrobiae bacterium]|nr:DUF1932 domain-containing protein [Verrucomicrobiae bacterium]